MRLGRVLAALMVGVIGMGGATATQAIGSPGHGRTPGEATGDPRPPRLEIYYSPPVLVRAGERVRIPVDVVCTTAEGTVCPAIVTLGLREGAGPWTEASARATASLEFDVSASARRAAAGSTSGSVGYYLRAEEASGAAASSLPPRGGQDLRFYVARNMPVVRVRTVPFGHVRTPATVVFLPWGSGPGHAGLVPGKESLTLGPSSFDVGAAGQVYVLDSMQDRLAVFSRGGRLVREIRMPLSSRAEMAVASEGSAYVMDRARGRITVRRVSPRGGVDRAADLGPGLPYGIHADGTGVAANVLPLGAWLPVSGPSGAPSVGMPLADGTRLLRVVRDGFLRLGTVSPDGAVTGAVEIRTSESFGDVPLASPDGRGGYWTVVHVWRDGPAAADQYQVIHVRDARVQATFAVSSRQFAETPLMSRFRLGPDGALYQLVTAADGVRIARFDLGEGDR